MDFPLRKVSQIREVREQNLPSAPTAKLALKFAPGCPVSRGDASVWRGGKMDKDGETAWGWGGVFRVESPRDHLFSSGSLFESERSGRCAPGEVPKGGHISLGPRELSPARNSGGVGEAFQDAREDLGLQSHPLSGL